MKNRISMVALLLAMLLFPGISFAEDTPVFSLLPPNDPAYEEAFTGIVPMTINEDVPETVRILYDLAAVVDEMSSTKADLSVDDLYNLLDETEMAYWAEEDYIIYLSDYLRLYVVSCQSAEDEDVDIILSVALQVILPVHSETLPELESIYGRIPLYERKMPDSYWIRMK